MANYEPNKVSDAGVGNSFAGFCCAGSSHFEHGGFDVVLEKHRMPELEAALRALYGPKLIEQLSASKYGIKECNPYIASI